MNQLLVNQKKFYNKFKKHCQVTHEHIKLLTPYINIYKPIRMSTILYQITYYFSIKPISIKQNHLIFHKARYIKNFHFKILNKERHNNEHVKQMGPYINSHTKISFKCLDCGKLFKSTPNNIFARKYICPNRMSKSMQNAVHHHGHRYAKWTTAKVAKAIRNSTHGEYELAKDCQYINARTNIDIVHKSKQCQYYKKHHKFGIFSMRFDKFYYRHDRCPYDKDIKQIKTTKQFAKEVDIKSHHKVKLISSYKRSCKRVKLECINNSCPYFKKYGKHKKWLRRADNFLLFPYCPVEAKQKRIQRAVRNHIKRLKHFVIKVTRGEYLIIKYYKSTPNGNEKALFEHHNKNCSYYQQYGKYYRWIMSISSFKEGARCPLGLASNGELCTMKWLNVHKLSKINKSKDCSKYQYIYGYIIQYNPYTPGNQHFDFYLPKLRWGRNNQHQGIEIEFNGSQHFKPTAYFSWRRNKKISKEQAKTDYLFRNIKDFAKKIYCNQYGILKIDINNPQNYTGTKLKQLTYRTLNHKLLPILKQNRII